MDAQRLALEAKVSAVEDKGGLLSVFGACPVATGLSLTNR